MTNQEQEKLHAEAAKRAQRRANFGVTRPRLGSDDVVSRGDSTLANVGKWTK